MSIAKVGSVKSSASAIDYIFGEKKGEKKPKMIGGNVLGETKQEIKDKYQVLEKFKERVLNTVIHIVASLPKNTRISDDVAAEYADRLMEKLGYSDNLYIVVRHYDKDDRERDSYAHIHIIVSRVNDDGSLIDEWKNAEKVIAAAKEIDREMNLESAEYIKNGEERNIKKNEYRVMQSSGKLSVMEEFGDAANVILEQIDSIDSSGNTHNKERKIKIFAEKIQEAGFEILPNFDEKSGSMRGFSYKKDEIKFSSRAAGGKFKWQNLAEKLGYETNSDHQFLMDLHTQTIADIHAKEAKLIANSESESTERHHNANQKIIQTDAKDFAISSPTFHESSVEIRAEKEIFSAQSQFKNQIRETKINETTVQYSNVQPSIQPNKRAVSEFGKTENDSPESAVAVDEKTRIESVKSVEKAQIDGRKSSENEGNRNGDAPTRSRKIVVGNGATNRRNADERTTTTGTFAEPDSAINSQIKGLEKSSYRDGINGDSIRAGDENHEEEFIASEQGLSKISDENQRNKAESNFRIDGEGSFDFGSGNGEEFAVGNRNLQYKATALGANDTSEDLPNANKRISFDDGEREEESAGSRKKISKLEREGNDDSKTVGSSIGNSNSSSISGSEFFSERTNHEISAEREQRIESYQSENESGKSGNGKIDRTDSSFNERFFSVEFDGSGRQNYKFAETVVKAEVVAQIVNVKYFAGQLDEKIIDKWTSLVENANPTEFLKGLLEPETPEESEQLFTDIGRQAELIAQGLSLPKPKPTLQPNLDKLAMTLTQIEVRNFEKSNGDKVNFLTLERLWNEKTAAFEELFLAEQNDKIVPSISEFSGFPIFSTNLEIKIFQALLDPESHTFDADYILQTEKLVERDELAAEELANLVQISYGGQEEVFTPQFKSILAEEIYYDSFSTVELYNEFSSSNWQETVERFAPIIDTLAEKEGILIQPPASASEKDSLLAEYFTGRLVFIYEQNNGKIDDQTAQSIFDSALSSSALPVRQSQKDRITLLTDDSLKPLDFDNALEADIYLFDKFDESSQCQITDNIVDFQRQKNQRPVENNLESGNDEYESNGLAM